ncbi:MAG: methyltransferase domain-containing protein [Cryomorphaceae bacterium]|nr:methyltransferase domain-containing protein [Cryomorphaceae bacterium]
MQDDIFGSAFQAFLASGEDAPISVWIDGIEQDGLLPSYFFRSFENMPMLEQNALKLACGKTLDVGAAAGCHAMWLQENGIDVTALEISEKAADVCSSRGVKNVVCADFFKYNDQKFDTILLLMNGFGMGQDVEGTERLLKHAMGLLSPGGQIIGDTSDISYFDEIDDIDVSETSDAYYGCVFFELEWKDMAESFNWIYPAPALLAEIAARNMWKFEILQKGPHHDFLLRFSHL